MVIGPLSLRLCGNVPALNKETLSAPRKWYFLIPNMLSEIALLILVCRNIWHCCNPCVCMISIFYLLTCMRPSFTSYGMHGMSQTEAGVLTSGRTYKRVYLQAVYLQAASVYHEVVFYIRI